MGVFISNCQDVTTLFAHGQKGPAYLMHARMLLRFWSKDRTAELWVGSHNRTNRAVYGLNIEASLVAKLRDSSQLFIEALNCL